MQKKLVLIVFSLMIAFCGCGKKAEENSASAENVNSVENVASGLNTTLKDEGEGDSKQSVEESITENTALEETTEDISKTPYIFVYKEYEKNAPAVDYRGEYYIWRDEDFSWEIHNYINARPSITIVPDEEQSANLEFMNLLAQGLSYNELKTTEQAGTWSIGMCDGVLEEYLDGNVGRSIYVMEERIPLGLQESMDCVPKHFYRVIWGHDNCDVVVYADFPYDWTREQVNDILAKVHVDLTVDVLDAE